ATSRQGDSTPADAAFDLAREVVEDAQVLGVQHVAAGAAVMVVEGAYRGGPVVQRITDGGEGQPGVESRRWRRQRGVGPGPQAESGRGQPGPREQRAGVGLARGRQVLMANDLRARDVPARGEVVQQPDHAVDLRTGEGAPAVVVDLDAERSGVD